VAAALLHEPIYRIALILQLAFYSLGIWALIQPKRGRLDRIAGAASTFLLLNTAALIAFVTFISGRKPAWTR